MESFVTDNMTNHRVHKITFVIDQTFLEHHSDVTRRVHLLNQRNGRFDGVLTERPDAETAGPGAVFGINLLRKDTSTPGRSSFLDPNRVPPINRNQISEPLMTQLVGYNLHNILTLCSCRTWLDHERTRSERQKAPILLGE